MDLPECVSQGKTLEEARHNIKDAIKAYMKVEQEKSAEDRSYHLPEEIFIGEIAVG